MNEKAQSLYKFIILCISTAVFYASVKSGLLWDLSVYDRAVYDFINNDFPYRTDISLQFVYHPYVLMMLDSLRKVSALKPMLMLLYLLATIFFGKQLFQYVCLIKQKEKLTTSLSIFWLIVPSIGFGGAGIVAFQTGNMTLFLHFLVLGAFFAAKKNSTCKFIFLFQCSILFAAIVKPYYLAYLILLIYLTDYRRFTLLTLITVSLAAVIWLSASIFTPNLYEQFVTSLAHQTLGKGDLGYAIFGLLRPFTGDSISILVHVAVMLLVLMGIIVFIKQEGYDLRSEKIIPLVIAFIIFLNPRMKEYDFIIAIFFSYLFLFLVNQPVYLKAVCLSWGIATVPLFSAIAIKLGLMEPIKILTAQHHFQILGFLVLSVFLMLSLKFTKTS